VKRRLRRRDNPTNEPTSSPTKKGPKEVAAVKPTNKPTKEVVAVAAAATGNYELKFAVVVPTKCDEECQSADGYLGSSEFDAIEKHLQDYIENNFFGVQLKREGEAVGLFDDSLPKATGAKLEYRFASKSSGGLTWPPSKSPTHRPTPGPTAEPSTATPTTSGAPTGSTYYVDYENHVCKNDGGHSEFEVNFFKSLEDCCSFPWIDYDTCIQYSFTNPPTSR
jgi:hypothetical protein